MKHVEDVLIVGGGPAGAYCAFNLAKNGIKPLILDHSHPREKPCGGGVSPVILKKFPFLEKFRSKAFTFGDFKIVSCIDTEVITKSLENGFCISREHLDQEILNMAIESGARIIPEKVLDIQMSGKMWKVATNKRQFYTKILIGADGVNSVVRRKTVGSFSKENLALTFGYLTNSLKKDDATIKFLAEIPGYVWVFPGKGYSNIGIGSELKYGKMLKSYLDAFIDSNFPKTRIISRYAAMLPSASDPNFFKLPCSGANWVLIGDAAGHVDPISGGGILYALWDGQLAANAIEHNNLKSFDKAWKEEYGTILEERCKQKKDFYDPLKSTINLWFSSLTNKTYFLHPI
jgi:geranylgeranyl reductase family protein